MVTAPSLLPPARSGNRSAEWKLVAERCCLVVAASLVVVATSRHSSEASDDSA
jgi:hypothetical protein